MANLVRVFAAETGTTIGDESFAIAASPDVIIEVEASLAEWVGAQQYLVSGFARDYASGTVRPLVNALAPYSGSLRDANWPDRNHQIVFTLDPDIVAAAAVGGIVELVGAVRIGAEDAGADADFVAGMFTWVAP